MNDEIVRFRTALISRQQGAAGAVAGEGRGHGWDVVHASTTSLAQKLARAPFFDEPAWARGGDDVSLQGTSVVESRAIAALRKRDRVREIYHVTLTEAAFFVFSGIISVNHTRRGCSERIADGTTQTCTKTYASTPCITGRTWFQMPRSSWCNANGFRIRIKNTIV